MKKVFCWYFIGILFFGLGLSSYCNASETGITVIAKTPAAEFKQNIYDKWTYESEAFSIGVFSNFNLEKDILIKFTNRFIFGSNEIGNMVGVVGNTTKLSLDIGNMMVFSYEFTDYWEKSSQLNPLYQMCTGPSQVLKVEVNIPIFSY